MNKQQKQQEIINQALLWLGTPYHHAGRVMGAGVDCGTFILEVFNAVDLMPFYDPGPYPQEWHLHKLDELYLQHVLKFFDEVETPEPGDIVLFKIGLCVSHGGIIVEWPLIIHSYLKSGVVFQDVNNGSWPKRLAGFYRAKELERFED